MQYSRPITALSFSLLLCACSGSETEPEPVVPSPAVRTRQPDLPAEHPAMDQLGIRSRGPRRLSVTQLEKSLDTLGNLEPGTVVIPPDLALTLGRPDYLRVYETSLEPSPLFMKFMMDLGTIICANLGTGDRDRPEPDRVFTRYPDRKDNLEYMVLRFLGLDGDEAQPYITRLDRVYIAADPAPAPLSGYEAVCIALITSPEFLLY